MTQAQTPRPQLSLCVPVLEGSAFIAEFHLNLLSFFQKFPLQYEVLFGVDPSRDESLKLLQNMAEKEPRYKVLANAHHLGRAKTLEGLFRQATGDILVCSSIDLSTPLGEIFKMLQAFYADRELELVFGDRLSKRQSDFRNRVTPKLQSEAFFRNIIHEKVSWPFHDPFCSAFAIRKKSFEKIQDQLQSQGWHWSHEVQRIAAKMNLKKEELPLFAGAHEDPSYPLWSERLRLLRFVMFRI